MTTKKHLKRRVRARAAETGEPYVLALEKVRQEGRPRTATTTASTPDLIASCSFCAKPNTAVQRLVAGPGVYICNECVELAAWVVEDAARGTKEDASRRRAEYQHRPTEDVLAALPALVHSADRVANEVVASIDDLRERGADWHTIADAAGMSVGALRQRFGVATTE